MNERASRPASLLRTRARAQTITVGLVASLVTAPCVVATAPRAAYAQGRKPGPPPKVDPRMAEAKRLFEDGATAYGIGDYENAIKLWEKSYEISQKALIFDNIANAWEKLGDFRKTRENLSKWRDAAPAEERAMLDKRLQNLDARISREDDAQRRAASDKAARDARERELQAERDDKPWLLGTIVGGAGLVAVVAGVVVDAIANGQRPSSALCKTVSGQTLCQTGAASGISTSNRMAIAGDVTWIVGAAAVATGAVLVFIRRPAPKADVAPAAPAPPPAAWLAPTLGGLIVGGTF